MQKIVPHFWIAAGGVALAFLGLIGPWATLTSIVSANVTGLETEDGKILAAGTAGAAMFLGAYAFQKREAWLLRVSTVLGVLIALTGIYYLFTLSDKLSQIDNEYMRVSIGWGVYATAAGGVAIALGSLLTLTETRKQGGLSSATPKVPAPIDSTGTKDLVRWLGSGEKARGEL